MFIVRKKADASRFVVVYFFGRRPSSWSPSFPLHDTSHVAQIIFLHSEATRKQTMLPSCLACFFSVSLWTIASPHHHFSRLNRAIQGKASDFKSVNEY